MKNEKTLWTITRNFGDSRLMPELKTLLFCGNGFLGVQANAPGSSQTSGTFINGFYETTPITYGEKAYGYPGMQQVMIPLVDVLNWEVSKATASGYEALDISKGTIELDMQKGIRKTSCQIVGSDGSDLLIQEEVLTSLVHSQCLYSRITLKGRGKYRITRRIGPPNLESKESGDPRKMESLQKDLFRKSDYTVTSRGCMIEETTTSSNLSYRCTVCLDRFSRYEGIESNQYETLYQDIDLDESSESSRLLMARFEADPPSGLPSEKVRDEQKNFPMDWQKICSEQENYLKDFWKKADTIIEGKPEYTRALRYNSYGLLQSTGTDPARSGAAKGLSSGGYNGHTFWDADIYIQGALNNIDPRRARTLVEYRIAHLKEARDRAEELSEVGALYPWRTINGRECSAFFPAGTAQFHINADIIWGLKSFLDHSGERDILLKGGAEMLFETARFWAAFALDVPGKGYCLHCVTGPDEYTALVNNNFYTNLMAREHLSFAHATALELLDEFPEWTAKLIKQLNLSIREINSWRHIAHHFYLPKVEDSLIYKQDDSFLEKSPWDWEHTPLEKRPLLLHYHPLKIYRHRVMKQPDVIMGLLLQKQYFDKEVFASNFDYYEPLTSGDSSLSSAIQSAVAALGDRQEQAEDYFRKNLFLDLEDKEGNTDNGIHLAAMGGARIALLYGFAHMEISAGVLHLNPDFPRNWGRISFSLLHKGVLLKVHYDPSDQSVQLTADAPLNIEINETQIRLSKNEKQTVRIFQEIS
ncbi:glycoside hydrolase family 65 protein [Oceanispirochaeta crateris]|uniref:Glycoside hydrolase family 65 protein n=1 Tax=Oceanispirochaeta crateris TaxID=2518645 RepID=A0A5C1QJ87_9SPIO|nr:glycosyl hydrolase family 65 protein [Oceanispirochaeta crateris]QEN06644.1 glycoside hydrolase family 65 protein [Oceanispirochaeta crateris]